MENPFLELDELEPELVCPPRLKAELLSEIDMIRNIMTVAQLYIGDIFAVAATMASPFTGDAPPNIDNLTDNE